MTRSRYNPPNKSPTLASITIGDFTIRLAVQADVDAEEAQAVGNLLIYHSVDGRKVEYEVD